MTRRPVSTLLPVICLTVLTAAAAAPVRADDEPVLRDLPSSFEGVSGYRYGTLKKTDAVSPGYTLIAPLTSTDTFLVDPDGNVVHQWKSDSTPGNSVYLLEDGSLLRTEKVGETGQFPSNAGSGGRIRRFDWDGNLTWDFSIASSVWISHHDIEPMPDGNVLVLLWESYTADVARQLGRKHFLIPREGVIWFEAVVELKITGPEEAEVVWRWSALDHLVQNSDANLPSFAEPAEAPHRLDINYVSRLRSDWIHMNSVDYNPQLDQIMLSSRSFDEIWVIDHSTTTEEAAGSAGGRSGRGGDLLFRWGNPQAYGRGDEGDQKLFGQHDPHWIAEGLPGAGNVLLFNNGERSGDRDYSSADEIEIHPDEQGRYPLSESGRWGPDGPVWTYQSPGVLFSPRISGVQRLPNGNTLICSGSQRTLIEVTREGEIVWIFKTPHRPGDPTSPEARSMAAASDEFPDGVRFTPNAFNGPDIFSDLKSITTSGIPIEHGGTMFRAVRYGPDYPAFRGRSLRPAR